MVTWQVVEQRDEAELLTQALDLFETSEGGLVSEIELRRLLCMQNGVQLGGIEEEQFELLLRELAVTDGKHRSDSRHRSDASSSRLFLCHGRTRSALSVEGGNVSDERVTLECAGG